MNVENFYTVIYEKFELPSHEYLAANETYSKKKFNLHPEEISQLKVDYRKHYIEISKSY